MLIGMYLLGTLCAYLYTYQRGLQCCCLGEKAIPEPQNAEQQDCSPAFFVCVHEWKGPSQSERDQVGTKHKGDLLKKGTGCNTSTIQVQCKVERKNAESAESAKQIFKSARVPECHDKN